MTGEGGDVGGPLTDSPASLPGEARLPVAGTDGTLEVSNLGRVRRLLLLALTVRRGQVLASFQRGRRCRRVALARLVAEAFLRPLGPKEVVYLRDGDPRNCRVDNLVIAVRNTWKRGQS